MTVSDDSTIFKRGPVPDAWFERAKGIPMTKEPVRALAISLLTPLEGARVLEIGTGTGGMTVELLRAAGANGHVVTLETSREAASLALLNIARAEMETRAEVILGAAPEKIPPLPFDAVFLGGHGGDFERIADACWERLEPKGRLLLTAITPRTTARALAHLKSLGARIGFWRVAAAVGREIGDDWLPSAHNPIDLIWGDK